MGAIAPVDGVKPGGTFELPAGFTNTGAEALDKVWLSYGLSRGLGHAQTSELPSNCSSLEILPMDEAPNGTEVSCEFDQTVEPGVVYAPERQQTFDVLDIALYDMAHVGVMTYAPFQGDNVSRPVPGTGPAIKLVERPDATPAAPGSSQHGDWDVADVPVTAVNTADFRVTGARVKGAVGDTVSVTVKYANAGPAWVRRRDNAQAVRVLIRMPAGTTVAKRDNYCTSAGSGGYSCSTGVPWVTEDQEQNFTFKLKIDKSVPGAEGSVQLIGGSRPFDPNEKNDAADIRLDVTGAGGGLVNTGSGTALPIAGAAAAVALGAGALLLWRRRANRR